MPELTIGTDGSYEREVNLGERFEFGKNWQSFLSTLDDERIQRAQASLEEMLPARLKGKRFLDAGSGSGLMSLAARELGAEVVSFDYDPNSVACTTELKKRYRADDEGWQVLRGSVLDAEFLHDLGPADIVYSWGVLHHTGAMWQALDVLQQEVAPGGLLFVALYNDQGVASRAWRWIKRLYCSGTAGRAGVCGVFLPLLFGSWLTKQAVRGKFPLRALREYKRNRGMSLFHDYRDWLGGYPFEVARPEEVLDFLRSRGFELRRLKTTNRLGCNEFVFERVRG
jgi:2-polyprenyl-6-hydroxyphenyl methylase/3-demethylubiquinone-9 3-methyltransferase